MPAVEAALQDSPHMRDFVERLPLDPTAHELASKLGLVERARKIREQVLDAERIAEPTEAVAFGEAPHLLAQLQCKDVLVGAQLALRGGEFVQLSAQALNLGIRPGLGPFGEPGDL